MALRKPLSESIVTTGHIPFTMEDLVPCEQTWQVFSFLFPQTITDALLSDVHVLNCVTITLYNGLLLSAKPYTWRSWLFQLQPDMIRPGPNNKTRLTSDTHISLLNLLFFSKPSKASQVQSPSSVTCRSIQKCWREIQVCHRHNTWACSLLIAGSGVDDRHVQKELSFCLPAQISHRMEHISMMSIWCHHCVNK